MKEEWKFVMAMHGEQFVMTTGMLQMLMLCVANLDINPLVNMNSSNQYIMLSIPR